MFSDGIRPGCDLAELDTNWNAAPVAASAKAAAAAAAAVVAGSSSLKGTATTTTTVAAASSSSTAPQPQQQTTPATVPGTTRQQLHANLPPMDAHTRSYIPRAGLALPPICADSATDGGGAGGATATAVLQQRFVEVRNDAALIGRLQRETLRFAVQRNLYVLVRIVTRE